MATSPNAVMGPGYSGENPISFSEAAAPEEIELDIFEDEDSEEEAEEDSREFVEEHYSNLTALFDEEELKAIGNKVMGRVQTDINSRAQWIANATKGLRILGLNLDDSAQALWDGSCTATHPLVLETGTKLQQKLSVELFPSRGPTRVDILGVKTEDKLDQANRVKQYLDYQISDQMTDFPDYFDKTVLYMAIFGTCFQKTYMDPELDHPASEMVRADLLVVNQKAPNVDKAERLTHMDPISTRTLQNRIIEGFYRKLPIADDEADFTDYTTNSAFNDPDSTVYEYDKLLKPGPINLGEFDKEIQRIIGMEDNTSEEGFLVYDHYCYWDFKGKDPMGEYGRKLPYIVSVDEGSGLVLSIRRDWAPGDVKKTRIETFTAFNLIPFSGFYAYGLIHLLGNFNIVLTAIMRSLTDAGQLFNLQGGYKLKGARIVDNSNGYSMGEYKDVEGITGTKLGDAFMPHQFKEPSQVLLAMFQFLDSRGGQFANATDQVVADNPGYGNVGSTTALLDVAEKLYTGIFKRGRKSVSRILKILGRLNYEYLGDDPYPFSLPSGEEASVIGADFDPTTVRIQPSADPDVPSQAKRAALDQIKIQMLTAAKQSDQALNVNFKPVFRSFFKNLDPQMDINEVFPADKEAKPQSPLEDIISVLHGEPIKAFEGQDHQAHIMFKNAWLQDPNQGAAPINATFVPNVQSNIREHMIMQWQESIGAMSTGVASDPKTQEMLQAQMAQELSRISQATANQGSPEQMVAEAVQVEAQAKMKSADNDERKAIMDYILQSAKTAIESRKVDIEASKAGTDAEIDISKIITDNLTKLTIQDQKSKDVRINKAKGA